MDLGFVNWPYLVEHSPFLAPLVGAPELQPVFDKAKARWESLSARLAPDR